jgi:hypothetical protein
MPIEDKLITAETVNALRINKEIHLPFYAVFLEEVQSNTFLTKEIRLSIVNRWAAITPKIDRSALKVYLSGLEKKFWAAQPQWEQKALTNKITSQTLALQEEVKDSSAADAGLLIKKARVIDQLNQTVAKVNRLIDVPPIAQFIINTNIDEASMTLEMNSMQQAEVVEDEE